MLRKYVAPPFFRRYPSGQIDFFHVEDTYISHTHALRKFFFMHGVPDTTPEDLLRVFPGTLNRLHSPADQFFPGVELDILTTLFFPQIYAFIAPQVSSALVFHLGSPQDGSQAFPPSFEHWWRPDSVFQGNGEEQARRLAQVARGEPLELQPLFPGRWSPQDWKTLFRWYVTHLEQLLRLLLDFAAFADDDGRPRYSTQFKTLLTLKHIATETLLVLTTLPSFIKKTLTFDILDQYATLLTGGTGNQRQAAKAFSQLVNDEWLLDSLGEALKLMPEPFSSYFSNVALHSTRDAIHSSILKGVFVPEKRPASQHQSAYIQKVLRALRNTRHGFFLDPRKFDEALAVYDGNLTEKFPGLAALFWLALLARPRLFLGKLIK